MYSYKFKYSYAIRFEVLCLQFVLRPTTTLNFPCIVIFTHPNWQSMCCVQPAISYLLCVRRYMQRPALQGLWALAYAC